MGVYVRAIPQSLFGNVLKCTEFLCLLRDFVAFFNFVFIFQVKQ